MSRKKSLLGRIKRKFSWRGGGGPSADAIEEQMEAERQRSKRKSKSWLRRRGRRGEDEDSDEAEEDTDDGPLFDLDDPYQVLIATEQAHELSVAFDLYSKVSRK